MIRKSSFVGLAVGETPFLDSSPDERPLGRSPLGLQVVEGKVGRLRKYHDVQHGAPCALAGALPAPATGPVKKPRNPPSARPAATLAAL